MCGRIGCIEVFENRELKRTFLRKRNAVRRNHRKLHIVRLHNLYSSENIIRMIQSRRLKWVGRVIYT
jgi:hypothetical protein